MKIYSSFQKLKQDISNSEFGLTKSKITPANHPKTVKKMIDVSPTKEDNSVSELVLLNMLP